MTFILVGDEPSGSSLGRLSSGETNFFVGRLSGFFIFDAELFGGPRGFDGGLLEAWGFDEGLLGPLAFDVGLFAGLAFDGGLFGALGFDFGAARL